MIGRTLSHYEFLEELGRGGMGVVYRARDLKLHRDVAIKVLPPDVVAGKDSRWRFEQEARAAAALGHPNIAVIHEIDEVDGVTFIVMEYLRARVLRDVIPEHGLPVEKALDVAAQVADGLSCAHASGIVHRDIKPGNVMVTSDGHIKIIDFGLAKLVETPAIDDEEQTLTRPETEVGIIVGTTTYMSPEQARGETLDGRTDSFSLGAVLFEMLTGQPPFRGRSAAEILSSVLRDPTPSIRDLVPGMSARTAAQLQAILDRCLAKNREDRYPSAELLVADLRVARQSIGDTRGEWLHRLGRWARVAVVAGVLATLVLFGLRSLELPRGEGLPFADIVDTDARQYSVAVLGFRNLSGQAEAAWLSTALSEMLGTELAIGDRLRIVSGEDVARMKTELELSEQESFAKDTLERIRQNLGCDYVVVGSYVALGEPESLAFRLDVRLQDTIAGETLQSVAASGSEDEIFDIVREAGTELRQRLGASALSEAELDSVRASASSVPEATRLYAEGLAKLRSFDAAGARATLEEAIALDPDFALAHAAMSRVWVQLGYDARAQESAERALALSEGLPGRQQLLLRALHQELSSDWAGAVETLTVLWARSPKNVDYGLRLASAQGAAGSANHGLDTVRALRRLPAPLNEDPRIDLTEAELAYSLADYPQVVASSKEAVSKARSSEASLIVAEAMILQSDALWNLGDLQASANVVESAIELFERLGHLRGVATGLNTRAIIYEIQGNLSTAETLYRESVSVAREIGDRSAIATALYNMADTALKQGALRRSAALLAESAEIVRDINDPRKEATRLTLLARIVLRQGKLAEASVLARDAHRRHVSLGAQERVSETLALLSEVQLASGELTAARESLQEAVAMSQTIGQRVNGGRQLTTFGELLIEAGELDEASDTLEEAVELLRETDDQGSVAWNRVARARILLERGQASEAESLARASGSLFEQQGRADQELRAGAVLCRALVEQGKTAAAGELLERIEASAERSESPTARLEVAIENARLRSVTGDDAAARSELAVVLTEAKELGLVPLQYEARLLLASVGGDVDPSALAAEAREKGFLLVARKAASAAAADDSSS